MRQKAASYSITRARKEVFQLTLDAPGAASMRQKAASYSIAGPGKEFCNCRLFDLRERTG
ncbi:MAG: hypothetical protein LIO92_04260 [Clostridiales bacterium]|nr:hypothetical protein [Clostridiales bacterium]